MSKWLREKGLPGLDFKFNYWSITEKARVVVWPFKKNVVITTDSWIGYLSTIKSSRGLPEEGGGGALEAPN